MKQAKTLTFQNFTNSEDDYSFEFIIDGESYNISLKHSVPSTLEIEKQQTILFSLGMCYLLDLAELVLPTKVFINFAMTDLQLHFWQNLFQEIAKEKMFVYKINVSQLENSWEYNPQGQKFKTFSLQNSTSPLALCLTGGKESLALLKLLRKEIDLMLFFLNPERNIHRRKVFDTVKEDFLTIKTISNRAEVMQKLRTQYQTSLVSGVDMFHLVLNTLLLNAKCVLIGNEYGSNFPNNIVYQGYPINHQLVKTIHFAKKVNWYLEHFLTTDFVYYSPFFGIYEYKIAQKLFLDKDYLDVWTSCNKTTDIVNFCCQCHKCAFTYLLSVVFVSPSVLQAYFSKDLLEDLALFKPLIDFTGEKPLDCVGDKKEVWVALEQLLKNSETKNKSVVQYYATHIRPIIKDEIADFEKEINTIQQIPQTLPKEIDTIITKAFS